MAKYFKYRDGILRDYGDHIKDFENIDYLSIEYNELISFDYYKYPNLTNLNLSTNMLTSFDPPEGTLLKLQRLNLRNNNLTSFNPKNLHNLTHLDISQNDLKTITFDSTNFPKLKSLSIFHINLESLESLDYENLEYLSINNNNLTTLNLDNFKLPNLLNLDARDNKLNSFILSKHKCNFPKLESLYLCHNKLTSIDNLIFPKLKTLYLNSNKLTLFEYDKEKLPSLTEMHIYDNNFKNIRLIRRRRIYLLCESIVKKNENEVGRNENEVERNKNKIKKNENLVKCVKCLRKVNKNNKINVYKKGLQIFTYNTCC